MATSEPLLPTPRTQERVGYQWNGSHTKKTPTLAAVVQDSTSSPGDSRVSLFPKPGKDAVRKMIVTSGRRCFESYENFIRAGSSVKMLAASLLGTAAWYSNKCSLIWKVKVTPSKRLLFLLAPSTPHTGESESGLLLTPTVVNNDGGPDRLEKRTAYRASIGRKYVPGGLAEQIKMLPTPNADSNRRGARSEEGMHRGHQENLQDTLKHRTGTSRGLKLQPAFVEWMMGYPDGWTELSDSKLSEMRSSRKSRRK